MIPTARVPSTAATASKPATSATPGEGASLPFDSIFVLETFQALAAQANATAGAAVPASAELAGEAAASGSATDGETGGDDPAPGASLEFLCGLINLMNVPRQAVPAAADSADAPAAGDAPAVQACLVDVTAAPTKDAPPVAAAAAETAQASSDATNAAAIEPLVQDDSTAAATPAARATDLMAHALRHGSTPAAPEPEVISTPVRDPRWAQDLGTRVTLMVRGGESQASLQLTPVDLGPLDVNVSVRDSQATVHFGAANAETRALLEASIPKLREMLAAQGFQLMDSSVSQGFARSARPAMAGTPRPGSDAPAAVETTTLPRALGLLDLYA